MSRTPNIVVSRSHKPEPDSCARTLLVLLRDRANKKAAKLAPEPNSPDNAEDLRNDRIAKPNYSN